MVITPARATVTEGHVDTRTAALLAEVRHTDGLPVRSADATFVEVRTGRRHPTLVRGGLCGVTQIAPGSYRLEIRPSYGVLGVTASVGTVETDQLSYAQVEARRGATLVGQVVEPRSGRGEPAALVGLLDAHGEVLEHTRTDSDGRFVLGHGLSSGSGLSLVVSSGHGRHHVRRTSVGDIALEEGHRTDVGPIALERASMWAWA